MANNRSSDRPSGNEQENVSHRMNDPSESSAASQALRPDGGVGGVSGTGQALPHHGIDDDTSGREALRNPIGDEASLSMPDNGATYQAGGTHLNRERQVQIRKSQLAGSTPASAGRGGLDPAPGAPVDRR